MSVDGSWGGVDRPDQPERSEALRTNLRRGTTDWKEPPTDVPDTYEAAWPKPATPGKAPPIDEPPVARTPETARGKQPTEPEQAVGAAVDAKTLVKDETYLVEDLGPGAWGPATESMSERAQKYQAQITGAPPGMAYQVGKVNFDGYSHGVLQDAKGPGYGNFVKDGIFRDWFTGKDEIVDQATRQRAASNGYPITWYIADEHALEAINRLFRIAHISGITLVHVPAVE